MSVLAFFGFGMAFGQAIAPAQGAAGPTQWPEVTVNALLESKGGKTTPNLSTVQILEDGVPQTIKSVSGPGTPVSLCLVLDLSGSMTHKASHVPDAAVALLKNLPRRSEVMVVAFRDKPVLALPLTPLNDVNAHAFDQLTFGHRTALYDSLIFAEENFVHSAHYPRRAMALITDGEENHSHHSGGEVRRSLLMPGSPLVYVLQINEPYAALDTAAYTRNLLSSVRAHFDNADTPDDLPRIAVQISQTIDKQYAFTYTSPLTTHDARLHKLEIKTSESKRELKIESMPGYYAPAP
jgi:VWFA-related protein